MNAPSKTTLKKYGLSADEWIDLFNGQHGNCACGKELTGRICIDHLHVKGWKKMTPEQRKKFVRGLTHWRCNYHFLGKGMDYNVAINLANYLWRFENK